MIYSDCRIFKYHRNILQPLQVHVFLQGERNRLGLTGTWRWWGRRRSTGWVWGGTPCWSAYTWCSAPLRSSRWSPWWKSWCASPLSKHQSSVYSFVPVYITQASDAHEIWFYILETGLILLGSYFSITNIRNFLWGRVFIN